MRESSRMTALKASCGAPRLIRVDSFAEAQVARGER